MRLYYFKHGEEGVGSGSIVSPCSAARSAARYAGCGMPKIMCGPKFTACIASVGCMLTLARKLGMRHSSMLMVCYAHPIHSASSK